VDALGRLLASEHRGAVLVSPLSLEALALPLRGPAGRPALPAHAGDGAPAEAPRDEIEEFLAEQWHELLGATSVGLNDDFFDLGGHSLLALRLFARLEKRFGASLPLATLFEAPTVARLAERVRGGPIVAVGRPEGGEPPPAVVMAPSFAHLIRIRAGGDAAPFFCVHGAGGNVLNFRDLARRMGDERAVYGLQARGVDGLLEPHGTIEEMAAAYVDEIRQVQEAGPYLLGGYSGGGVIAFEMAHQLRAASHEVAAVVLLDTFLPGIAAPESRSVGERGGRRLRRVLQDGPKYVATWARERAQFERWRLLELRLALPRGTGHALPAALREVKLTRAFHAAADRYAPQPLPVPIILFTASQRPPGLEHVGSDLGWSSLAASGLDVRFASGTHDDLVREPHVRTLADDITSALRDADVYVYPSHAIA
jgi:thioesterase domain-containing protein/acyl carrier protein